VDAYIHEKHGLYGVDYPHSQYSDYQDEARRALRERLVEVMQNQEGGDVVLDSAFAFKEDRHNWRELISKAGGRSVLVYLDANRDVLWRRIQQRQAKTRNADSAFEITEEILDGYLKGFEVPKGEGE
jgi:predicted kinase